jgi:SAM-dependent methyltransferase
VGCSLGYLLRHLETEVCTAATVLDGVDIDAYAVESGSKRLAAEGSRARLVRGDATELPRLFPGRRYDLVLCAGVLMYLRQADAAAAVREMLACCRGVVAFAGLAHPEMDNRHLAASVTRDRDRSLIHNLDAMVAAAGGNVVSRRWEGARQVQGNTLYFVFARPASSEESHGESEDALASTFRLASPASSSAGRPQSKAGGFIPPAAAATSSIELAESTDAIASPASPKSLAGAGSSGGAP